MDNAATTLPKPPEVAEAIVQAMNHLGNAGRGSTEASLDAARVIYDTRERLGRMFHAENPKQIAFTSNATESLNIAIQGLINPGDHVITTVMEHNSVLRPLYERQQAGATLTILPADKDGNISYDMLEAAVRQETKAIICTHGSNLTGNLNDIEQIGKIAKAHKLLFIVDASQTAGVFPIDVQKMGIDVLCFTGHKSLYGPQGTGGIYVRNGIKIRPLKRGGSGVDTYNHNHPEQMPTALEAGTLNGHGIAGLNAALKYVEEKGMDVIKEVALQRAWQFYDGIKEIPGVAIYGDFSKRERCPIVSFNLYDYDSAEVSDELLMSYGISTRAGGHCAPLMHESLHNAKQGAVRFSFSHFNTKEEVEIAIRAVRELSEE
ncbi:aminotransferase class V-fold PLP-dependent enzyme [Firmicutes bacterium AM41-5BH]|nr:aminotransferase class V-fold PLP-dependent enzyme [Firmicutes bacterium AM41-5BH]